MSEPSFYSIDRLVEFGLSLGVATQMAQSMNTALREMSVPGAGKSLETIRVPTNGTIAPGQPVGAQSVYYVVLDGKATGPLPVSELTRLIAEKRVTKVTYVWIPGMSDWQLAESVPEVLQLVALVPPPIPE